MTQANTSGRWGRAVAALAAATLACAACGDDGRAETYRPVGPAGMRDAGGSDAGVMRTRDAGSHDTEIFSGDLYLCGYDREDTLVLPAGERAELAVAAGEQGFALVHGDAQGALFIEAVPLAGTARDPVRILASDEAAASATLAGSSAGFLLAWRSGGPQGGLLRARELSSAEHPVVELTSALAAPPADGELFALLGDEDGYLAAWLQDRGGERAPHVLTLGQDGAARGDARAIAAAQGASAAEHLALVPLEQGRSLLSWLERGEDGQARVLAQMLGADLAPAGEPAALSRHPVQGSRFAMAGRGRSAGVIYAALDGGVREALKFRRVEGDGAASAAVLNVLNAPGRAVSGSIAAFGQGYAVAYRALPSLGAPVPVIRVAFIDQFGAIVHEAELAETTEAPGPTALAATEDGHLLVAWTNQWPSGPATHALALDCPGALVLCGGELR